MKKFLVIALLVGFSFLSACALKPRDTGTAFMFSLSSTKAAGVTAKPERLIVKLPTAAPELDTYRIALIRNKAQWDYYAGARWAEFLPSLVQDSLTKTIEDSKLFKAVTTDQAGLGGDQILKIEIRAFHAAYEQGEGKAPVVRIQMTASLLPRFERTPLSSFDIRVEKPAAGDSLSQIQAAFDQAFQEAQMKLIHHLGR